MEIVTGMTGTPHVTSTDHRNIIAGIVGKESYIMNLYENLEAEVDESNVLKIKSGVLIHHGCVSVVPPGTWDEIRLERETEKIYRTDLVVARYEKDQEGYEKMYWHVIKGEANDKAFVPKPPSYTKGDMNNGDVIDDCPVFEVWWEGGKTPEIVKRVYVMQDIDKIQRYDSERFAGGVEEVVKKKTMLSNTVDNDIEENTMLASVGYVTDAVNNVLEIINSKHE